MLRVHDQRGRVFFASLFSRRREQCTGNPEPKREYLYGKGGKKEKSCGNEDCHIVRMNKYVRLQPAWLAGNFIPKDPTQILVIL